MNKPNELEDLWEELDKITLVVNTLNIQFDAFEKSFMSLADDIRELNMSIRSNTEMIKALFENQKDIVHYMNNEE